MTVSAPTDFPTPDAYQSASPDLFLSLPPMMIFGFIVLLLLAAALGWMMARRRTPDDDPSEAIYDAIKKAIAAASGAPRDQVVATARKLRSTLDDRLGAVLAVSRGLGGPCAELDTALEGLAPDDHGGHDGHDKPESPASPSFVIHAQRDVTIHAVEPAKGDDHADGKDGHGDRSASDPGKQAAHGNPAPGHAHGKPVDAQTQIANIRAAVHALSDHWTDKAARLAELRAARRQLTTGGGTRSANDRVRKKS